MVCSQRSGLAITSLILLSLQGITATEVQNKLTRISLRPYTTNEYTNASECTLRATDDYFGLKCDEDFFNAYIPDYLSTMVQDSELSVSTKFTPREVTKPVWSFSEKFIVLSAADYDQYYYVWRSGSRIRSTWLFYQQENGVKPVMSATHNSEYAEVMYKQPTSKYQVQLHYLNFKILLITLGKVDFELDVQPAAIHLEQYNNIRKLYTARPSGSAAVLRIDESISEQDYINPANLNTPASNCAGVLASSAYYFVAACPQNNIITVYNNTSYQQICTVNGPTGASFGETMAIYQHTTHLRVESKIATIFVSGLHSSSNLHYVTQVHIIPSQNSETINCYVETTESEYLVSHTLSTGLSSAELEVGVSNSVVLVHLKTKGEIYSTDRRALYKQPLNSFYSTSSQDCPDLSYSTSVYSSDGCHSCSEIVNSATDPLKAYIKEAACCSSSTLHGPHCQECVVYMPTTTTPLPQNSEWVNGETCTSQCLSGYSEFAGSGLCESQAFINSITADTCYSGSTCSKCNAQSCYFNGGVCTPGSTNRMEALHTINEECGRDTSFCGTYSQEVDLSNPDNTLSLTPPGQNSLKAMKGLLCEWSITLKNLPSNWEYSLITETQTLQSATVDSSAAGEGFILDANGNISLLSSNGQQFFAKSEGDGTQDITFTIGMLSYTNSYLSSPMTIQIKNYSTPDNISTSNTGMVIAIVTTSLILAIVILCCVLCCCRRKKIVSVPQQQGMRRVAIEPESSNSIIKLYNDYEGKHEEIKENSCAICLDDLRNNLVITKCNHMFHKSCLGQWLGNHSTCPCCRELLQKRR